MEWKQVEAKQSPDLVDATSCPGKVYVRKDIWQETRKEESGEESIMYTYQEALMTTKEYESYSGERAEKAGTNDNQTIIMSALADIVDMLMEIQG